MFTLLGVIVKLIMNDENQDAAIAAAAAFAVFLLDDDDDEALEMIMNVANIAALQWMAMDGDEEVGLGVYVVYGEINLPIVLNRSRSDFFTHCVFTDQLRSWQHVTVNINEYHTLNDYSFRLHFRMSRRVFEV